jgi:hypothetical protein
LNGGDIILSRWNEKMWPCRNISLLFQIDSKKYKVKMLRWAVIERFFGKYGTGGGKKLVEYFALCAKIAHSGVWFMLSCKQC